MTLRIGLRTGTERRIWPSPSSQPPMGSNEWMPTVTASPPRRRPMPISARGGRRCAGSASRIRVSSRDSRRPSRARSWRRRLRADASESWPSPGGPQGPARYRDRRSEPSARARSSRRAILLPRRRCGLRARPESDSDAPGRCAARLYDASHDASRARFALAGKLKSLRVRKPSCALAHPLTKIVFVRVGRGNDDRDAKEKRPSLRLGPRVAPFLTKGPGFWGYSLVPYGPR